MLSRQRKGKAVLVCSPPCLYKPTYTYPLHYLYLCVTVYIHSIPYTHALSLSHTYTHVVLSRRSTRQDTIIWTENRNFGRATQRRGAELARRVRGGVHVD